jgi:hypothetical protein
VQQACHAPPSRPRALSRRGLSASHGAAQFVSERPPKRYGGCGVHVRRAAFPAAAARRCLVRRRGAVLPLRSKQRRTLPPVELPFVSGCSMLVAQRLTQRCLLCRDYGEAVRAELATYSPGEKLALLTNLSLGAAVVAGIISWACHQDPFGAVGEPALLQDGMCVRAFPSSHACQLYFFTHLRDTLFKPPTHACCVSHRRRDMERR